MLNIISLGAGVQSSTMALMAAHGEITPMPDCAIFADTQGEPKAVYEWLDWLESKLPFKVHRVSKGNLWEAAVKVRRTKDGERTYIKTAIPVHMTTRAGEKAGIQMRTCTMNYKIAAINDKMREIIGMRRIQKKHGKLVNVWIGISSDEARRAKPNVLSWVTSKWPLLEHGMSRADCLAWMEEKGYPYPPRSACIFCPFRDDDSWLALSPEEFSEVVEKEKEMQVAYASTTEIEAIPFFHHSRIPLSEVKLVAGVKKERDNKTNQLSLFSNECEGMCGV